MPPSVCRALLVLLLGLFLVGGLAPAASAQLAKAEYGDGAFSATNARRVDHDLDKLRHAPCLEKLATRHARRMANQERIWHQDLTKVLAACDMTFVGENVASGFSSGTAVVNDGWMLSKLHRENILEERFRRGEVVARKGENGVWYACQLFGRR
jgi:uncharacterized protein YkwD